MIELFLVIFLEKIMTIKRKLFLLIIIPTLAIFFFSAGHISDTYNSLQNQKQLIKSLELIKNTSNLLHELQYQRGLSSSYLNSKEKHFKELLKKQEPKTKKALKEFFSISYELDNKFLSILNKSMISDIKGDHLSLEYLQKDILDLKISAKDSFKFFTHLNSDLIEIVKKTKLYSQDDKIYNEIQVLKLLILFREFAGQERALVAMLNNENFSHDDMRLFYSVTTAQINQINEINQSLQKNLLKDNFELLLDDKYINNVRKIIKNNLKEKIDLDEWITISTQRIDNYYKFEKLLYKSVYSYLSKETTKIENFLLFQILLTIATMFILLLGAYLIAKNIQTSLDKLSHGINDFFDFLNFKTKKAKIINLNSNDELNEMAEKINKQIKLLELSLDNDKDFINEITQISILMKNGDFSEKPYFEPTNPYLIDLKIVFNELITLISDKVKEQTKEVELINSRLSDEVYFKTLELERKVQDITRARDIAVQAEKSKDDFLANMSHEIRTPLNAILGFVTILKKRIKNPKNTSYLNIIDTSGNSLLAIINDILDFSKIQSGKFTITPNEINPIEELSNTTILFASKAYEKHLIYAVYIDPKLPQTIYVDDVRVKQILSNLLSNAIKFTPSDGMIKVRILIEDEKLIISVQDSGIGIAKENLTKVFSAFEQADGTTTRKYGGTGSGLSISAKLAKLMDGELKLVSTEGKGSTFTLKLPVKITNSSPKEFFDLNKVQKYRFAILNTTEDSIIFTRVIKKYLNDLNITDVVELSEYTSHGYDILFFVPDDNYNEEVVDAKIPAIAMLRSNQIKLAPLEHITALYAPFAPTSVIQAIDDITIENIQEFSENDNTKEIEENQNKSDENDTEDEVLFSGKVLIAEDNKTNQMLIKLILMDYELDFDIANDGIEAVKMYKDNKYDLILMDENMPNLNGLGAMAQIKEYEKENSLEKTPIIALTANALVSDIDKFLSAGMDGFVAKPIDTKLLEAELSKYLTRV